MKYALEKMNVSILKFDGLRLDWIGEMSRDAACAASLCSHDPAIEPQTIEF